MTTQAGATERFFDLFLERRRLVMTHGRTQDKCSGQSGGRKE